LAAGDWLKKQHGTKIVAAEALECPTMLYNGFGSHNIQGIGDKHIPLIHNVMNTDVVVAVSDVATDSLDVVFGTPEGRAVLEKRWGVPRDVVEGFRHVGLSGLCNIVSAIKVAKQLALGPDDAIITVATDGAAMYASERAKTLKRRFPRGFGESAAQAVLEEHLRGAGTDHVLVAGPMERQRIFNLGYFTWVEQQGLSLEEFEIRREPAFWEALPALAVDAWDPLIAELNRETGAA
jgi:hypothetical protein